MTLESLLGSIRIAQVPEENDRRVVIRSCCKELGRIVRVPGNSTDGLSVVVECKRCLLGLKIPHSNEATGNSSRQDVRNLPVPSQAFNIVRASRGVAKPKGVLNVVNVIYIQLTLCSGSSQNMGFQRVKLQCFDSTSVLVR